MAKFTQFEEQVLRELRDMKRSINLLNEKFEALSAAFVDCKTECENLKQIVNKQSSKINYLEMQVKKKNLTFWGVQETSGENYDILEANLVSDKRKSSIGT